MNFLLLVALLSLCAISRVFAFNNSVAITYDSDEASRSLWLSIAIFYTRLQRPNNWLCTYVHNIRHSYGHWRVHWVFTFSQDNLCGIPRHSRHSKLVIAYYDNNLPDLILHAKLSNLDVVKTSYTSLKLGLICSTDCNGVKCIAPSLMTAIPRDAFWFICDDSIFWEVEVHAWSCRFKNCGGYGMSSSSFLTWRHHNDECHWAQWILK